MSFSHALRGQFARYLVVGGLGFAADALAYSLFAHGLGWPPVAARLAAFVPATVLTWWIHRHYTFTRTDGAQGRPLAEYLRYLAVQAGGIAINFVVFHAVLARDPALEWAGFALGSIVALAFNFAGSRWLVFTGRGGEGTVPVLAAFGALSVLIGQDANWDFANYHLYNAHAFVTGRIATDFAAAGLQTYFNPLLDVPYYWMTLGLPATAVAFAMGAFQAAAVVLLAAVVRRAMPDAPPGRVWFLAIAGGLGAAFLSELGNTMGDATTAVLVMAALVCAMDRRLVLAGLLVGAATGLKLTNAPYALGLAALVLAAPARALPQRLRGLAVLALAGIAGLLATGGYWHGRLASEFGNPLFPQFNGWFGSPLAASIGVADNRWGPRHLGEALAWPFIMVLRPSRLGETPLVQLLWPVVYLLLAAAVVRRRPLPSGSHGIFAFIAVSYAAWLAVFGIARYTVPLDMLMPLAAWLLLPQAPRLARALVALAVLASVLPFRTWGSAPYAQQAYTVPPLPVRDAGRAAVLFIAQPTAWMAVFWPREAAYTSMFNFPESPASIERVRAILRPRPEAWAVLPASVDTAANTVAKFNAWAAGRELSAGGWPCSLAQRAARASTRYRAYRPAPGGACAFELPAGQRRDLDAEDRAIAQRWAAQLAGRSVAMDPSSCRRMQAAIGALPMPFQLCRVSVT